MRRRIIKVAVSGAECTGKTTLVHALSAALGAPAVPEAARVWASTVRRRLTAFDIDRISAIQSQAFRGAERSLSEGGIILLDTDLVSTLAYARHYLQSEPSWLGSAALDRKADIYLVCEPDVPWESEQGQRGTEEDRAAVHSELRACLQEFHCRTVRIEGTPEVRLKSALQSVEAMSPWSSAYLPGSCR